MKRKLQWLIINTCVLILIYLTFFENIEGAKNLLKVFIWIEFFTSIFTFCIEDLRKIALTRGPSVNPKINLAVDLIENIVMIYFGWIFLGVLKFLSLAFKYGIYDKSKENDNKDAEASE